jgi:ADP-heptose:LPS heptosyltransferase
MNLREAFPDARFQVAIEDRHAFVLEPFVGFEPVLLHRRRLSHPLYTLPTLRRVAAAIQGASVSLDFHGFLKSALVPWLARIPERWGDGAAREGAHLLQTHHLPKLHETRYEQALGLAEAFGRSRGVEGLGRFRPILRDLRLPEPRSVWSTAFGPRILLVPGSSPRRLTKRWPPASWVDLARALAPWCDVRFVLGPSEAELREHLPQRSGVAALPVLPFWELAAVFRQAHHVVTGDTGLLHLAVVSGVPVTALFGPSDPVLYGLPPGAGRILRAEVPCSPCRSRTCANRVCLDSLEPRVVRAAVEAALERPAIQAGSGDA